MKTSRIFSSALLLLLLAASAFAANKEPMQITDPVSVGGKQLKPGDYTVSWDGDGPNVRLNIMRGSKTVITVPAHVVPVNEPRSTNSIVAQQNSDGSETLSEIRFSRKKYALQIGDTMGGSQTGGNDKSDK